MCAGRCRSTSWPSRRLAAAGAWDRRRPVLVRHARARSARGLRIRRTRRGQREAGAGGHHVRRVDVRRSAARRRAARSPGRVHRGRSCRDAWRKRAHHHDRLRRAVRHPGAGGPAMKRSMRIVVVGGSGLIGKQVMTALHDAGHHAVAASPTFGSTRTPARDSTRRWPEPRSSSTSPTLRRRETRRSSSSSRP